MDTSAEMDERQALEKWYEEIGFTAKDYSAMMDDLRHLRVFVAKICGRDTETYKHFYTHWGPEIAE